MDKPFCLFFVALQIGYTIWTIIEGNMHAGALKTREWKTRHQVARVEIAGLENVAPDSMVEKRGEWKTRELTV